MYEQHESYWFRICLRYGRNRTDAQDIFQEGVGKVFQVLDQFDEARGSFEAWSNRVIVNEALKYLKKNQWQASFEELENIEPEVEWPLEEGPDISAKALTQMIQQLPFGYRVVFNMYEIEGYTHREIATYLGISVGTSKSQLSKAKRTLQQQLKQLF